ncbi:MAG: hypothetical protein Q4G05_03025 [Clostridia bacterium]|nr:hypothetical protein [Clostridia bacterium]
MSNQNKFNILIESALNDKISKGSISLAKVSKKVAEKIQKITGINTFGRRKQITASDIKHILKHSDIKKNKKRTITCYNR